MSETGQWLFDLANGRGSIPDGLVAVDSVAPSDLAPEHVPVMEKAREHGARFVFFQAALDGRAASPQAFVFVTDTNHPSDEFALCHQRLWNWGGVPLLYRASPGRVDLFRCAHKPDFMTKTGQLTYKPEATLRVAAGIANASAWWSADRLRNGTLWDDPEACEKLLSGSRAAHISLVTSIRALDDKLAKRAILEAGLRRRLLIICLLVAYLEERGALEAEIFAAALPGAQSFFQVFADGPGLVSLLTALHRRFNGHIFKLKSDEKDAILASSELEGFAQLIEGHSDPSGQLELWKLYSFADLPVGLISHIYQIFVDDPSSSVYTPPALVKLMVEEALSWERLDRLHECGEVILDPACGSGIFLVEAYRRLVLHWRLRHGWAKPGISDLRRLIRKVHGIDLEKGAIQLANFSLCLALCDALEPQEIRASLRLFPKLRGRSLHAICFFAAREKNLPRARIGVVLGNPPFISKLTTDAARRNYEAYKLQYEAIPDLQLAYLFLHESMRLLAPGGLLSMLQQYGLLYNQGTRTFRARFFTEWDVQEILDFVSIRGLFRGAKIDTKVVVVVAAAQRPADERALLHAVFRRDGRAASGQGFAIDYYDMHWVERTDTCSDETVWRANLVGGGRAVDFVRRLQGYRTLGAYAKTRGWKRGEGFAEGQRGVTKAAAHIHHRPHLPSIALTAEGIDRTLIYEYGDAPIEGPRTEELFTPPMLLVREHMDIHNEIWNDYYITFKNKIVGFAAPKNEISELEAIKRWLRDEATVLRAFAAGISIRLFTQKATTLAAADILALPYPEGRSLECSANERLIASDIVTFYREFIRLGEDTPELRSTVGDELSNYNTVFISQINTFYDVSPLRPLAACRWPGVVCQPFVFGEGDVDWTGAEDLAGRINGLLREQRGSTLTVTRVARIYDGHFIFLIKPDRSRYWLASTALRDSDDTLADLRAQGF